MPGAILTRSADQCTGKRFQESLAPATESSRAAGSRASAYTDPEEIEEGGCTSRMLPLSASPSEVSIPWISAETAPESRRGVSAISPVCTPPIPRSVANSPCCRQGAYDRSIVGVVLCARLDRSSFTSASVCRQPSSPAIKCDVLEIPGIVTSLRPPIWVKR